MIQKLREHSYFYSIAILSIAVIIYAGVLLYTENLHYNLGLYSMLMGLYPFLAFIIPLFYVTTFRRKITWGVILFLIALVLEYVTIVSLFLGWPSFFSPRSYIILIPPLLKTNILHYLVLIILIILEKYKDARLSKLLLMLFLICSTSYILGLKIYTDQTNKFEKQSSESFSRTLGTQVRIVNKAIASGRETNSLETCKKMTGFKFSDSDVNAANRCIREVLKQQKDMKEKSLCSIFGENDFLFGSCLVGIAVNSKDSSVCKDGNLKLYARNLCFESVAQATKNKELCVLINDVWQKKSCENGTPVY